MKKYSVILSMLIFTALPTSVNALPYKNVAKKAASKDTVKKLKILSKWIKDNRSVIYNFATMHVFNYAVKLAFTELFGGDITDMAYHVSQVENLEQQLAQNY